MATDFPCKRKLWYLATEVLSMRIHGILLEHMATEVFRLVIHFDFAHTYNESLSARSCTSGGGKISSMCSYMSHVYVIPSCYHYKVMATGSYVSINGNIPVNNGSLTCPAGGGRQVLVTPIVGGS